MFTEPIPHDSADHRPNSGLRDGDISHAEVNEAIRQLPKTIIFGQQNRLRDGVLMEEDERLERFHAGHGLYYLANSLQRGDLDYIRRMEARLQNWEAGGFEVLASAAAYSPPGSTRHHTPQ